MGKRGDTALALLILADIIVLVVMYPLLPIATDTLVVYIFDAFVVAIMARGFYTRMNKSQQGRRRIFILNNWYEILAMIPIAVFAAARS
jgi:hypothetical protein